MERESLVEHLVLSADAKESELLPADQAESAAKRCNTPKSRRRDFVLTTHRLTNQSESAETERVCQRD